MTDIVLLVFMVILGSSFCLVDSMGNIWCGDNHLGVNYGTLGNDLPDPRDVAMFLKSMSTEKGQKIRKIKLFGADEGILRAFAGTEIEVIVGVRNEEVAELGGDSTTAAAELWLQRNVVPYLPDTWIRGIAVGNEVMGGKDKRLEAQLLPAMTNLHMALQKLSLNLESNNTGPGCNATSDSTILSLAGGSPSSSSSSSCSSNSNIIISSPISVSILNTSLPPSAGTFLSPSLLSPFLSFLSLTSSPFMANIYPFFAFSSDPSPYTLNYSLFLPLSPHYLDPVSRLHYTNMFDAQLDAIYSAISHLGFSNVSIMVSETGWPSHGDADQVGASIDNAQTYTNNLINHVSSCIGTPLQPEQSINTYIFALFNENMKPGPTSERNYGLFKPDMTPVYTTTFSGRIFSLHSSPFVSPSVSPLGSPHSPSLALLVSSSTPSKYTPFPLVLSILLIVFVSSQNIACNQPHSHS